MIKPKLESLSWLVRKRLSLAILVIGIILSGYTTAQNYRERHKIIDKSIQTEQGTGGIGMTEIPGETDISNADITSYNVEELSPRFIRIPKLGVEARVKQMGISTDNAIEAPRSIFDAGWYKQSAKPSEDAGVSLIDGHVSGPTKHGIFKYLYRLDKGDEIHIERGDGKILRYVVFSKEQLPADQLDTTKLLLPLDGKKSELNLITCSGKYNRQQNSYPERLLIHTTLVNQ